MIRVIVYWLRTSIVVTIDCNSKFRGFDAYFLCSASTNTEFTEYTHSHANADI